MSCNIQLNTNGKILSVNADNGEKSLLFATLSSLPFLSKEQAAELYLLAKKQATKNTIKDVNGEPQIVFQPLGGEHEYLLTDKMVTYTDFYKALSLDASERGVRFGILTAKNVEEFNPTNSLEHKKLVEIAKKADSTKTTISTNNTYISDNPKDFILVDKFDRATNTNSKDGFLASLINLGIKIKPKQKTGIPLAIERNNGNPLNLAPNGKPSILFQSYKDLGYSNEKSEELVAKTYSDEFLAWFGDWTKLKTSIKPFKDSADKWDINMMMQPLSSNVGGENKIEFASYIFHSRWFKYKGKNKPNIFHYDNENKELHISGDYPSWRGEYIKFSNIDNFEEATKKFKEYFYENYISDESKSKVGKLVVEKEYSGISKVVDKNGQPLLVFHGTDTANITTFKEKITFFTTKYHLAKDYGSRDVKTVFLNMKTPKEQLDSTYWKFLGEITNENGYYEVLSTDGFASLAKDEGVDGTIMRSIVDTMDKTDTDLISDIFAVFDPNQIKSATENLGDFSLENNDIRFQIIGEQGAKALDSKEEATYRMDNLNVARQMEEAGKTSKEIRLATGWEKHNSLWKYEIPDGELIDKVLKVGEEYPIQEVITDTESSAGLKIIILDEKEFISEEERARYNPVARRIEINERTLQRTFNTYSFREMGYKLPSELRRTISHEIQHDTQRTNGFSGGGNFGTVVERAREIVGDEGVSTNEDLAAKIDTSLKDKDINAEDRKVLEAVQDILSAKTRVEQNTKLEKYYRRIAGEVEARNVEKRLNMSLEERQNNLLSETEDVAREDQILLRNTLGTQASTNNSQELLEGVYEQLKKAKVVDNTYFLSNQEIEDKLRELGYSEDIVKQVSAWHGSPHSFVRFTTEKMGTGEGAQAFGWGLYFTDLESIAKGYAKALTKQLPSFGGKTLNVLTVEKKFGKNKINGRTLNLLQKALSSVNGVATKQNLIDFINENTLLIDTEREEALTLVDKYNDGQNKRNLYKVSLHKGKTPDQYTWLEWDKKIEQKTAKKLAETIASKNPEQFSKDFTDYNKDVHIVPVTHLSNQIADMTGLEFYKSLSRDGYDFLYGEFSKEVNTEKEASLFLLSAGIDGVKYPAESLSRGATSDTARGFNYVVFDENAVTIEEQIQFQKTGEQLKVTTNGFLVKENGQDNTYINLESKNPTETLLHEHSHGFLNKLKQSNPEMYQRGIELVNEGSKFDLPKFRTFQYLVPTSELDKIKEFDRQTPLRGDEYFQILKEDIRKNGIGEPITVISRGGKMIIDEGNHRLRAAKELGIKEIPVGMSSYKMSDEQFEKASGAITLQMYGFNNKQLQNKENIIYNNTNPLLQEIKSFVKTNQPNLIEGTEAFANEVLAEISGRKAFELLSSKEDSNIKTWLNEFFDYIRNLLGLTDYTNEQVAQMSLVDYATAVGISLMQGKELFVGDKAQEYFTREADRLPSTLAVFNTKSFKDLQGKQVNPTTIQQLLNQTGIKQIEKDLINQVIVDNYQGQKKIAYDELEATVRANIMPLERITTSSSANYGMDNLGDGNYGEANTIILNAPIEHGVTGHFSGDFKASGRANIKYVPKQLNDNVWVAVEEGYEANANDNNIYQYVGTAGTKEAVDAWIENYENPTGLIGVYDSRLTQNVPINKGMFGHIRVWQDGQVFYVAELQSDYFQKQYVVEDMAQQVVNSDKYSFTIEQKKEYNSIFRDMVKYRQTYFEQRDYIKERYKKGFGEANKEELEALETYKKNYEEKKAQYEKIVVSKARPLFEKDQKQFIASQKVWEQRIVREAIKEASLSGATSLRFPTPYTLSVIEGYIKTNNGAPIVPYASGILLYKDFLEINDVISYGYEGHGETGKWLVTESNDTTIKVQKMIAVNNINIAEIENKFGEQYKEGKILKDGAISFYVKGITVFRLENIEQSFGQPNTYTTISRKSSFSIEKELSDGKQTVAHKYEEIAEILKKERGEENVEIVTDNNGFDWYETKIEAAETQNPVVAFQQIKAPETELVPTLSMERVVEELILTGEVTRSCKM